MCAAAINAESRRVDRSIGRILETLQGADPTCTPAIMEEVLKRNEDRLYQVLKSFKPPNKEARTAVLNGTLTYRTKPIKLDQNQKDFILQISDLLNLDETQSFHLFQTFLRSEVKGRHVEFSNETLSAVLNFYYEERINLIKCVSTIFRQAECVDYIYYNQIRDLIERKFCGGATGEEAQRKLTAFANSILAQFKEKCEERPPDTMSKDHAERWATQCVAEQVALLELIFQLYYAKLKPAPPDVLLQLLQLFKKHNFGTRMHCIGYLNSAGRQKANQLSYLCVLLCLLVMNLDNFVEEIANTTEDWIKKWIKELDVGSIERDFLSPHWGGTSAHGPLLLAWAAVSCRISQYTQSDELQYQVHAHKAMQCKAIPYLTLMLSTGFSSDDPSLPQYKVVVKWLVSVMLAAFDVESLPINEVYALYKEIFTNNVAACLEFWKEDRMKDTQSALLAYAENEWPLNFSPLLSLLNALSPNEECASAMFEYMSRLRTYRCIIDGQALANVADAVDSMGVAHTPMSGSLAQAFLSNQLQYVQLHTPITVDDAILIPAYTRGRIVGVLPSSSSQYTNTIAPNIVFDDARYIIVWELEYSGWVVIFNMIDKYIRYLTAQYVPAPSHLVEQVTIILALIDSLFSHEAIQATVLQQHLQEHLASFVYSTEIDLLRIFMNLFQCCAFVSNPPIQLLYHCMQCIHGIARNDPQAVWEVIKRANLLDSSESEFQASQGGAIRHLLTTRECPRGIYPITIAFLDLLGTLLLHLQGWHHLDNNDGNKSEDSTRSTKVSVEEFLPCAVYIQTAIFSFYETWRYQNIVEKWKIGTRVLTIFNNILFDVPDGSKNNTNTSSSTMTLRDRLLFGILRDASFYQNLLNVVSIGPQVLEANRKRFKEHQALLEELVAAGCELLMRVLLLKKYHPDGLWHVQTPLELAISTRRFGDESHNLIFIIASYVQYHYNNTIPLLATELLTLLCSAPLGVASTEATNQLASVQRTTSIVGYFGSHAESLRGEFLWRLSGKTEHIYLRIAILRLLIHALETQPGLAELFVNIRSVAFMPLDQKSTADADAAPSSCIDVVLQVLEDQDWYLREQPQVFAEVLCFLHALWRAAPEQHTVISHALEQKKDFWILLTKPLQSDPYSTAGDKHDALCYGLMARAYILRILALEVFYIPVNGSVDNALKEQIEKYKANPNQLFDRCTKITLDPTLKKSLLDLTQQLNIDLSQCIAVEEQRVYGLKYYDTFLIEKKLRPLLYYEEEDRIKQLWDLIHKVNLESSLIDAQLIATKAWASFVQTIVLRRDKTQMFEGNMVGLLVNIAKRLDLEKREGETISTLLNELSATLAVLTKKWTSSETMQQKPESARTTIISVAECLVSCIKKTLRNPQAGASTLLFRLYSTLLLLFESLKTWKNDKKLVEIALDVLPEVLHCINNDTSQQPICLAILTVICSRLGANASLLLAPSLLHYNTLNVLLEVLLECLQQAGTTSGTGTSLSDPATRAEIILHTLLALVHCDVERLQSIADGKAQSNKPQGRSTNYALVQSDTVMCESLVIGGLIRILCNEEFSTFCRESMSFYNIKDERNPWHKAWCLVISLVTKVLQVLAYKENFVDQALEFVMVHQNRLLRVLEFSAWPVATNQQTDAEKESNALRSMHQMERDKQIDSQTSLLITMAQLEETEKVTALFYQLAHYRRRWRYVIDSPYTTESQTVTLERCVLYCLQQAILYIQKGSSVVSSMKQVSSSERKLTQEQYLKTVEYMLLLILRNLISFARLLSPNLLSHRRPLTDLESREPVLTPYPDSLVDSPTSTSAQAKGLSLASSQRAAFDNPLQAGVSQVVSAGIPSLGLIVSFFSYMSHAFTKSASAESSGSRQLMEEISKLQLYALENLLFIILNHFAIFNSPKYPEDTRRRLQQMATDLSEVLQRINGKIKLAKSGGAISDEPQQGKHLFYSAEAALRRFHSSIPAR